MNRVPVVLVILSASLASVIAGCGGRGRAPAVPWDERIITCRVQATVCESGTDMTGACLDPVERDLAPPPDGDPATCAFLSHEPGIDPPEVQGQAACERLFGDVCRECVRLGDCSACAVEWVAWNDRCPVDTSGMMGGGTPRPMPPGECPDAGTPDGGVDMDAALDAAVDAGPACVERDAGPDGGTLPHPEVHQILSFDYDHPIIGATPRRTIDLPPDLSPPAGIAPEGLLWAISETGRLVGWDLFPTTPAIVVDVDLAAATVGGTLHVHSFEIALPLAGTGPPPPGPPLPTDPPVDFVNVLVAAREGLFLFEVRVAGVTLVASELRANVEEAVFNPHPVLEEEHYTVFATTMPPRLWLTTALGTRPPSMSAVLTADPHGLSLEAVDRGRVWAGLQDTLSQEVASHLGPMFTPQDSDPQPRPLVAVGGPDEWFEFGVESGEPVIVGGAVNDVVVVVSATTVRTLIRAYAAGNLGGTPTFLEVSGEATAAETNRLGDTLFAHLVTAGTTSRMRVVLPNAISLTEIGGRDLPDGVEPLDMALGLPEECEHEGGSCSGFFHVVAIVRSP